MFTTLARIIKYGLQHFWRNGWLSGATIIIMTLALLMFESVMLFNTVTAIALESLQEKIDISVYFKIDAHEDTILAIEKATKELPEVKNVAYISKDKALERFRETHKNDATITKALNEVGDNPFAAALNIKAKNSKDYKVIASYLENEKFKQTIEKVTYAENQTAIDRLARIIETANIFGIAMNIVLVLIAIIITFNTIRLAIYSNREEIGVMRLVGASNTYIRGPYVVGGVLYGVIAMIISIAIFLPIIHVIAPYFNIFIPSLNLLETFYKQILSFVGYTLILGVALGVISSSIATSRYLKV